MSWKGYNPEIERMLNEKDLDGLFKKVELDGYENHDIREQAIRALGEIKDPSAIETLIQRLKKGGTPSNYIKWALLGMREEAVPALIELLLDEESQIVRLRVIEILGGTQNTKVVDALIQMLNVDDRFVRSKAVINLGRIGDMRAIDSLIPMLEDTFVREDAEKSLYRLGWQPEGSPPIPDIKTLVANSDIEGLIEATTFEKDIQIRRAAAEALGEFRDPRAIAPLISRLKEEDWPSPSHMSTANALAKIGSPAVEPLIQHLKDGNKNIRAGTALALGKIGDTKAITGLISNLWDPIPFVRWSAADALGAIGDPAVPALLDLLDRFGRKAPRATARALKVVAGQDFKDDVDAWKRWGEEYRQRKGTSTNKDLASDFRKKLERRRAKSERELEKYYLPTTRKRLPTTQSFILSIFYDKAEKFSSTDAWITRYELWKKMQEKIDETPTAYNFMKKHDKTLMDYSIGVLRRKKYLSVKSWGAAAGWEKALISGSGMDAHRFEVECDASQESA